MVMEPQPGSPTSPPFSPAGTALWDNTTRAATPSEETATPDETNEEDATELEPARKSTASSSSSSSSSSADIPSDIDVVELINPLATVLPLPVPEDDDHGAEAKPVDSSATPEDERAAPLAEHGAEAKPEDCAMPEDQDGQVTVHSSAEAKPDDWATWPEPPPPAVDDSFASSDSGGAPAPGPQVQTVSPANLVAAAAAAGAGNGFDPGRIPASVFQHRTSVSQAEWSMASNESLFSIQGAGDMLYPAGSRSHFDFFYDEAMAEAAAAAADSNKLPSLAEGAEPESREFPAPGSAESAGSAGNDDAKKAAVFRRQESGSGGSSSNFSFAFPILAETSPRKKDLVSSALYQPLEKEREQVPPPALAPLQLEPPVSALMEMTTEEERRRSDTGCCCCGCCWFDCSWCCRCPWWRCGCCCCSCPSFCRCSWCLCS